MATASVATQELIDQRLDTIDRALMGLMPRSERLKLMADVEKMVGDGRDVNSVLAEEVAEETASRPSAPIAPRGRRGRSRLALTSGVMGIVALVLLLIMPVTYIIVSMIGAAIGEVAAYALIGLNVLAVAAGGAAAIVFGIAALVRLSRRPGRQVGHGWAITGLCTGPMPLLLGGLALLLVMLPSTGLIRSERRDIPAVGYYPSDAPPANMAVPVSHDGTVKPSAWRSEPAAPSSLQLQTGWTEESAEPRALPPVLALPPAAAPPANAYLTPPSANLAPSAELIEPSTLPAESSTPPTENAALPPAIDG